MATEVLVSARSLSPQVRPPAIAIAAPEPQRRRVSLGPICVDSVDQAGAVERVRAFAASGRPHQVVTVNLDFISIASRNAAFRKVINEADLAVADGMPLIWVSRLQREPLPERIAGVELVLESCHVAAEMGAGVFLLGAAEGVAEAAGERLRELCPGLAIVGSYSPRIGPLDPSENAYMLAKIRDAAPGFLFVALGAPRQDLWIREHQPQLQVPVAMGVGCVLDLLAGSVRRAPVWMQRSGLEWAFRLVQEPQRLWRRYLLNDLPTLAQLACNGPAGDTEVMLLSS
ncbi:MAG: WecB/TagA/CpsF family glycosyltransferase [Chloroflexi bacterium]|nr:WecB/TagA/CpsF family glycosyltransferase [Chloroflexota bacterium]MBV9547042.1 WecB/TagA/CpsF family glycosyltransferase [Chloroflexota bacterium]